MSQEITVTARLQATKSNLKVDRNPGSQVVNMSGTRFDSRVQDIGTAYEQLSIGSDIGTEGWSFFRNLDATNYVEIGVEVASAFYALVKLKAGEACVLRLATGSVFGRANTSTVSLEYTVLED